MQESSSSLPNESASGWHTVLSSSCRPGTHRSSPLPLVLESSQRRAHPMRKLLLLSILLVFVLLRIDPPVPVSAQGKPAAALILVRGAISVLQTAAGPM